MAFPTLHDTDTAGGIASSSGSTIPVDYPSNVSSGDLLILIVAGDNTNRGIASGPTGYSVFITPDDDVGGATGPIAAYYKVAAGTETGSTSLEQVTGISTDYVYMHLRFSGWSGTLGDVDVSALSEASAVASISTVDVTAGTGAGDNLFCSVFSLHNTAAPTITYPTNFTGTTLQYDSPFEASLALDQEEDTGATFGSGGTWSHDQGTENVRTFTFVVPPSAPSGPTLTSPTDTSTGGTTGSGTVSTDTANGTLYYSVTTSSTSPSAAQVKAGQDHTGATAADSGSQSVTATGSQAVTFSGLTSETTYYAHYMHEDSSSNQSTVASADGFTTDDITAPTLTSPSATADGSKTGSGSVSTNDGSGTLYWIVNQSASTPAASAVKTPSGADDSGNQAVSGTGTQNISGGFSGLTAATTYYAWYMHEDTASNQSVVVGDSFTTVAAPVLSNAANTAIGETTATVTVDTTVGNGTLHYRVSTTALEGETAAEVKAAATNQAVSLTGTQTVSLTGLTAGTTYYVSFVHTDTDGSDSNVLSDTLTITTYPVTPTLSGAAAFSLSDTELRVAVTTDDPTGTMWWVVTQSSSTPSAAQIKAGQNHLGAAADATNAPAGTSVTDLSFGETATGLSTGTIYYVHFVQDDENANTSTPISSSTGVEPIEAKPPQGGGIFTGISLKL